MSLPDSDDRERMLEANLAALFAQAYCPVPIRDGFAEEVARRAATVLQRAPATRPRFFSVVLAAAASFLVGFFGRAIFERSHFARDSIVAHGQVAAREARGPWIAIDPTAQTARLALGEREVELCVPAGLLAAVDCGSGALALEGPTHAQLAPSGRGADVEWSSGGLSLRGFQGRVHGGFGNLDCAAADLDLSAGDDGFVRGWLFAGRARFEAQDGRRCDLQRGEVFDSHPPSAVQTSGSSALVGRLPRSAGGERRPQDPGDVKPPPTVEGSFALSGSVRGPDGQALQSFRVILLRELELPRTEEPRWKDFDDASGQFRFDAIEAGAWTVFVRAEGFALWTREHVALGGAEVTLVVTLDRGASLAGRVVDAASGAPLAGAVVISEVDTPAALLPFSATESPNNPSALALSGADGRFQFEHLAQRPTVLRATRHGFAPQWSGRLLPGPLAQEIKLEMSAGGAIGGRIEREDGSAWAGAVVVVMPQRAVYDLPRRSYGAALTDAGGAYRIDDLPGGACVVIRIDPAQGKDPTHSNEPLSEVREALIRASSVATLDFLSSPQGSRLAGRVLREDHTPMAAVTISIIPVDAPESGGAHGDWRSQLCGADGSFEFTDVPPGRYEIYLGVRTPMDIVRVDAVDVPRARNVDREVLAPSGEISGSVRTAADKSPILFAAIVAEREDEQGTCQFFGKVFSDETGAWRLLHLADGRYRVRAYAARGLAPVGRAGIEVRGGVATAPLAFELPPGSALTLSVLDHNGAAQSGVDVQTFDENGVEFQLEETARTDAKGRCALDGLPAGRTRVVLRTQGRAVLERWIVAQPPEPIDLELRLPGPLGSGQEK